MGESKEKIEGMVVMPMVEIPEGVQLHQIAEAVPINTKLFVRFSTEQNKPLQITSSSGTTCRIDSNTIYEVVKDLENRRDMYLISADSDGSDSTIKITKGMGAALALGKHKIEMVADNMDISRIVRISEAANKEMKLMREFREKTEKMGYDHFAGQATRIAISGGLEEEKMGGNFGRVVLGAVWQVMQEEYILAQGTASESWFVDRFCELSSEMIKNINKLKEERIPKMVAAAGDNKDVLVLGFDEGETANIVSVYNPKIGWSMIIPSLGCPSAAEMSFFGYINDKLSVEVYGNFIKTMQSEVDSGRLVVDKLKKMVIYNQNSRLKTQGVFHKDASVIEGLETLKLAGNPNFDDRFKNILIFEKNGEMPESEAVTILDSDL